jgi:hypothetical protein
VFPRHVRTGHEEIEGMSVERAEILVKTSPEYTSRTKYRRHESRTAFERGDDPRAQGASFP